MCPVRQSADCPIGQRKCDQAAFLVVDKVKASVAVCIILNSIPRPVVQVDGVTVPVTSREFPKHAKVVRLFHRHYTEKYLSVIGQSPWKMQVGADRVVREISQ